MEPGNLELMLDVFPSTTGVTLGETVLDVEPLAIPLLVQRAFKRAFETGIEHELSILYVRDGAEIVASARVKRLKPTIVVDVWNVQMVKGEPRDMMDI